MVYVGQCASALLATTHLASDNVTKTTISTFGGNAQLLSHNTSTDDALNLNDHTTLDLNQWEHGQEFNRQCI